MTSDELRAARALLDISADELAARAGVGLMTVRRIEGGAVRSDESGVIASNGKAITALTAFLTGVGIRFVSDGHALPRARQGVVLVPPSAV